MTIDIKALYDALAKVLGQKENVIIKFKVERKEENEENTRN